MLKKITLLFILILSFSVCGQKKELRKVDKLINSQDYDTALNQLLSIQTVIENSELKFQVQSKFLFGKIYSAKKDFKAAFAAFGSAKQLEDNNGSSKYRAEIDKLLNDLSIQAINKAVEENQNENFSYSTDLLVMVYNVDQKKNVDYLFYAASSAVNGGYYDRALEYYNKLKDLNYTGSVEKFYATEIESGEEIELSSSDYVIFQKLKEYSNFRSEKSKSKLAEIIKNIALIYVKLKKNDLAIEAIKDARKANPMDVDLILTEADLYIQLGDKEKFTFLTKQAIEKDPDNHLLYYNLGVITGEEGNRNEARSYYKRAIELDPTYTSAYLNLAALILDGEPDLVEKMNSLGNSYADNIKYEKLQKQREELFLEAVPVLEKLVDIDPSNIEALKTLKNIFGTIGDSANFKKMKEKLESIGQ